MNIARPKS